MVAYFYIYFTGIYTIYTGTISLADKPNMEFLRMHLDVEKTLPTVPLKVHWQARHTF